MNNQIPDFFNTKTILITGGAGFIGSHIADALLAANNSKVVVLDNLSNGRLQNIEHLLDHPRFTFVEGDIRDMATCTKVMQGVDYVSHQAALGSVPRSIANPILTNEVNISGFLNVITAAKDSGTVKRFVYAASSSTYGDHPGLPKVEDRIGKPLSPYAVTKYVNELYANVYHRVYGLSSVGLRYFNVFGPRQDPNNAYAAVIPIFVSCALQRKAPDIFGDGSTSRDFTYVANAVSANLLAMTADIHGHEVFNIACGERTSLKQLWNFIASDLQFDETPNFKPERTGDVKHSLADIRKAKAILSYEPLVNIREGLKLTINSLR